MPVWISKLIYCKVCDEITYPFPNFSRAAVEIWEWIINFVLHLTGVWLFIHADMKVNTNVKLLAFYMHALLSRSKTLVEVPLIEERWIYFIYCDVTMGAVASQITSLTIVYPTVYSGADQRKYKAARHWLLCGEFTGDRWIPRTNGQ